MEKEETDVLDIEIAEPERIELSDSECGAFVAFGTICYMGKIKVSFDDRMNAVNQSLVDFPKNTLEQHKSNICKTHNKTINNTIDATHEPEYKKRNSTKNNHARQVKKSYDKQFPSKLAAQNKKSKDKQRANKSDSWKKGNDDKKEARDAHNLIRDDKGTIICPLYNGRCARMNHKTSNHHLNCPLTLKFSLFDGKCYWNAAYGL